LPADVANKEDAILHRRSIVEAGMLSVRGKFWSSDKTTISANRRLERTLGIRQVTGAP
jgi:hypothetical protein